MIGSRFGRHALTCCVAAAMLAGCGGSQPPIVAYADELAHDAMVRMLQHDIGRLPVVGRQNPQQMVGYFNRASLLGAWTSRMEEEGIREHGWIRKWRSSARATKHAQQATQK